MFALSGAASLGYQIAWSRMFATGLGHEFPSVLAIICAFMGGMGLGALTLDKPISRSLRPGIWFAVLELVIGLWGMLSVHLIPAVNRWGATFIGVDPSPFRHWTVAFAAPFLAILPATAAMGATLPALERFVAPLKTTGRSVGALYAANTFGAAVGTLLSAFIIMPTLGIRGTALLLGGLHLLCAGLGFAIARHRTNPAAIVPMPIAETRRRLLTTIFLTGFLGIGYETVVVRVLSQVLENTIYTFAAALSVFLLGTATGAWIHQRCSGAWRSPRVLSRLLGGLAAAGLAGIAVMPWTPSIYQHTRELLGNSQIAVLVTEMGIAALVFGAPTILMGAIFSLLVQSARRRDDGVGLAFALNTFGAALAPILCPVIFLPAIGSKSTLIGISLGYLALVPKLTLWRLLAPSLALALALAANLRIMPIPPGGRLVEFREGVMASVAVVEDKSGHRTLHVDNRFQMGGTAAAAAEYRHAHIPLLLHPRPERALFLGLGTGITFGAAAFHPGLDADGVELVPEIIDVMHQFAPYNNPSDARLKVHVADARRFVQANLAHYDVIVADLFHPARDGAGSLFTDEHFRAIRRRLAAGGLFCQWLPLYQLDEEMLRIITRTFLDVFPETDAYLLRFNVDAPVVGLVGYLEPPQYTPNWIERRLDSAGLETQLKKQALADSIRLFGCLLAGPRTLREFAGNAPLNTDDDPRVTFGAPRFTYQKNAISYGRLLALLAYDRARTDQALHLGHDPASEHFAGRLVDYWKARDAYLLGLIDEGEGRRAKAVNAFVESARLSADFTPGYAQCLTLAAVEAKTNPRAARALLQRLIEAQPEQPVAKQLLQRLQEN